MDRIEPGEIPLSKVDQDLYYAYVVASKAHYNYSASRTLGKFVLTRFIDNLGFVKDSTREEVAKSREILSEGLQKSKILEVGAETGLASHFGVADYFDDLYFLNSAMGEVSSSPEASLAHKYDFVYINPSLLPTTMQLYSVLQQRHDDEHNGGEASYLGIDGQAYALKNEVSRKVSHANFFLPQLQEQIAELQKPGLGKRDEIEALSVSVRRLQGFSDLGDTNYFAHLVENHICNGGVLMNYAAYSPCDKVHGMQLFDVDQSYEATPGMSALTLQTKLMFKKLS